MSCSKCGNPDVSFFDECRACAATAKKPLADLEAGRAEGMHPTSEGPAFDPHVIRTAAGGLYYVAKVIPVLGALGGLLVGVGILGAARSEGALTLIVVVLAPVLGYLGGMPLAFLLRLFAQLGLVAVAIESNTRQSRT
jgi:hypothetical protein